MNIPGHGWSHAKAKKRRKTVKEASENELLAWNCLCSVHDLPRWHFKHRGLSTGYRHAPTVWDAAMSLFYWHNESVNIWSHYLTAVGLLVQIHYTWIASESPIIRPDGIAGNHSAQIAVIIALNVCGNVLPIFVSAFCHQFYCIDRRWHAVCWFMDFLGILTGMMGAGMAFAYLSFYCHPMLLGSVLYGMTVAYILAIQICWKKYLVRAFADELVPADRFPEFSKVLSTFGYAATVLPVLLAILLLPEYTNNATFMQILVGSVTGPVLMGLGIVCFAQGNFPERFVSVLGVKEDFFDFVGHSHQWWHLLSACLQFVWVAMCRHHFEERIKYGCIA